MFFSVALDPATNIMHAVYVKPDLSVWKIEGATLGALMADDSPQEITAQIGGEAVAVEAKFWAGVFIVFIEGTDGHLYATYWQGGTTWHSWVLNPDVTMAVIGGPA
jgi:hypothetical protein